MIYFSIKRNISLTVFAALLAALAQFDTVPAAQAAEKSPVGVVELLTGSAKVIRQDAEKFELIAVHSPIFRKDIIKTDPGSRIRLKFNDGSRVSLGADSTMKITKFVYSEKSNKRRSILTIPEGIFRVIVSKIMPDSRVEVQTATAVSAVRGTDWIGEATPSSTAIFVAEGVVSVRSGNRDIKGEIILEQGEGTSVMLDKELTPKKKWGQAKVSDFVSRTSVK